MSSKKNIRASFREAVFKRDRWTCCVCGKVWKSSDADPNLGRVNAHHITDRNLLPNGGYVLENGITVCDQAPDSKDLSCHQKVEVYHTDGVGLSGLCPDDLYLLIGSSLVSAQQADK